MNEPAADPVRHVNVEPRQEWLVCNGLGGYASGTIFGVPTRRYHGYLIAALPNPAGRVMMLNSLAVQLKLRDKRVVVAHAHNTVMIEWRLREGGPVRREMRPSLQFRGHDEPVSTHVPDAYPLTAFGSRIELAAPSPLPSLKLHLAGRRSSFVIEPMNVPDLGYAIEESRGYASRGQLYSPGRFRADLQPGAATALFASTEPWDTILTMSAPETHAAEVERRRRLLDAAVPAARSGAAAELVLAADQFVIQPAGRKEDHVRARAAGDEAWTVIAGYHWFTDWGRDTMISLEGLTLCTGRPAEAGSIQRMFAHHVRDGLVPNMFPEGANEGLYHTADATLWFFLASDRYLRVTIDRRTLIQMLPMLRDIIDHHMRGTRFGIHVDPKDGLLSLGAQGYQLTWMDAKAGDWGVTPRRGKAVEINALWYNALRLCSDWLARTNDREGAEDLRRAADRAQDSFNRRFWNDRTGCLYDVIDGEGGDGPAIRPNQLFAISLPKAVLDPARWAPVLDICERSP